MAKSGYVYILASKGKRLDVGVTSELMIRVSQHKEKLHPDCFTARYNIDQLFYECNSLVVQATARETAIKNMSRLRKVELIVGLNPDWRDFSAEWGKPAKPFG